MSAGVKGCKKTWKALEEVPIGLRATPQQNQLKRHGAARESLTGGTRVCRVSGRVAHQFAACWLASCLQKGIAMDIAKKSQSMAC